VPTTDGKQLTWTCHENSADCERVREKDDSETGARTHCVPVRDLDWHCQTMTTTHGITSEACFPTGPQCHEVLESFPSNPSGGVTVGKCFQARALHCFDVDTGLRCFTKPYFYEEHPAFMIEINQGTSLPIGACRPRA
jgi:hypothetical protein